MEFDANGIPSEVENQASLLILDTVGCALAAVPENTAQAAIRTAVQLGGNADCTIIGTGVRTGVANAVLANGALIRTLDLNDLYWGPGMIGHPSDNIAVALSVGERQGCSGREVLAATVIGYELYCRILDLADSAGPWDHVTASSLVAPAIAGRLMGLTTAQLAHALAYSVAHSNTLIAVRTGQLSAAKALANSIVAHTGVLATMLAAQGLTGPLGVMEGPQGFGRVVMAGADLRQLIAPMDGQYRLMSVSIKAYPCLGTAQAAITAALQARRGLDDPMTQIESVEVRMADIPTVRAQVGDEKRRHPTTRESADHSFHYLLAVALLDGEISERQFEAGLWLDPSVNALMNRITIRTDASLNVYANGNFPSTLRIITRDGQQREVAVPYPPGHPRNRMSAADVEGKFACCTEKVLDKSRRANIVQMIEGLRDLPSLRNLMDDLKEVNK
jgi:2-methylcitrate dehydratase